jgi:M6 family metalloprotease-like protein
MKSPRRLLTVVIFLGIALILGWRFGSPLRPSSQLQVRRVSSTARALSASAPISTRSTELRQWLTDFQRADADGKSTLLPHGVEMAKQRAAAMVRLIREDPERALKESLRLDEYSALPAEIQSLVERPFSVAAAYDFYPVCQAPVGTPDHLATLNLPEGPLTAFSFGKRNGLMSKKSLPVQGIALDGVAALDQHALRELDPAELKMAQATFPVAQKNPKLSFLNGLEITGEPIVALGGGKLYHFTNREELSELNLALAELEDLPGPYAGSDALFRYQPKALGAAGESFDLPAAQAEERAQASAWTEQPKRVFMIRVDFSDLLGASHTQEETATALNGSISNQIRAMSYGKTWINGEVSANTYRLPQTSAYYVNSGGPGESLNRELLRDARNTFRATRSGGDAAVNLGPESLAGTGSANGLGDYDIVGVLFRSMSMRSSIVYGGLAGGADIWMQGTIGNGIFTHEFGHNYGIGHSGFWQTSDGSVTGAGANVEYGDRYDIMGGGDVPKGHFHSQAKARLNWLAANEWNDATLLGSTTHRLYRIDSSATVGTPRGVRITRSSAAGAQEYLWLGYRPSYTGMPYLESGAYMVWQRPNESRSWLVDTTPTTSGEISDAPIGLGRTYVDAASSTFITPLGTGGVGAESYLDVRVNLGPFPENVAPVLGAIIGPANVPARSATAYALAAANDANNDTLAYAWSAGDGRIFPNTQGVNPSWVVGGNYNLSVVVSDMKGGTATAQRAVAVVDPLDTWTLGSTGTTHDLSRLVYAKGRYLASNYWGESFLSWDGISWSAVGQAPDMDQPQFAFGANVFVAAGLRESANSQGQFAWSTDGRFWEKGNFPQGIAPIRTVIFGEGRFLALGDGGSVLRSLDGITWTSTQVPGAPAFRELAWTGSAWIAIATNPVNNSPEVAWTSLDGLTWTQRSTLGKDIHSLFSRNGVCYALGWYAGIKYSTDHGLTWEDAALPAGTRWTTDLMAAAPDGTLICTANAMDEPGSPGALLVSTDGRGWTRSNGNVALGDVDALVFGNGQFYAVDDAGVTRRSQSFYPNNSAPIGNFITAPAETPARQSVTFAASANDADGDALTFAWDFHPQMALLDGSTVVASYVSGGPQTVTLRISDARGGLTVITNPIQVSDPLQTWTSGSVGSTDDLNRILFANGRYLAASYWGNLFLSFDGLAWSAVGQPPEMDQPQLASGGGGFVAAGLREGANTEGQLAWSADGRRWRKAIFPAGIPSLRAVVYDNGRYVAVGENGVVLTSLDGLTWSLTSVAGAPNFRRLVWTGSTWIAMAMHPVNGRPEVTWTSPDAITWTQRGALGFDVYSLFSRAGVCYALGWYGGVTFSTDQGQTWQQAALPVGTRWTTSYMAATPDGTLICMARAMDESGSPGALLISTNGLRWTRALGNSALGTIDALTYAGGRFLAVDNGGVTRRSENFFSTNAAPTVTFTTFPASAPARQPIYLAANATDVDGDPLTYIWDFGGQVNLLNGQEIAPTFDFGGTYSVTLRVSDGRGGIVNINQNLLITDPARTFINRPISGTAGDFQAIASGGGRVVAVGSQISGSYTGPRAWSTDGVTWNTGNVGPNRHLYGLVHDGTRFVGAGAQYGFSSPAGYRGWIATSPDGVTWTDRYFAGSWLNAICYGGGVYLAAGDGGSLVRSTDGLTWTAVAIPGIGAQVTFQGLAWNGSVFLLTGYTGNNGGVKVFTSVNGSDWMDQAAGAGVDSWQDLRSVAWLNDRFIASGWYSKLRVSSNAGATFTSTRSDSEDTPALAYGSGIYFAAGTNFNNNNADTDLYSRDGVNWSAFAAPTTHDRRAAIFYNNTFITVGDNTSVWQSDTLTSASGFAEWQASQFPDAGLAALATADPDNDGLSNRQEYALGLAPLIANRSPTTGAILSGRASLQLTLPEPARSDIVYRIHGSTDLSSGSWVEVARKSGMGAWTWQAGGGPRITLGTASNGQIQLSVGQPDATMGGLRYFFRLGVEDP